MTTSIKQVQGDLLGLPSAAFPITSSIDYILINPCPSYIQANFTASGKSLTFPEMDLTNSLRPGSVIRIENAGSNPFDIKLDSGATLYSGLLPNDFIDFYLETGTSDGVFLYTEPPFIGAVIQSLTAPYTIDPILDNEKVFMAQNSLTIPPISLSPLTSYPDGFFFTVKSPNSNTGADIYPTAPDTIDDQTFYHLAPYSAVSVVKNNVNGKWSTLSSNAGGFDPGTGILQGFGGGTGVDNGTHTLTIDANSTINQNVSTTASPTFAGMTLSNGATVRTGVTASDSYSLGAYGAGSGTYKAFVTFTNDGPIGGAPQCVISAPSGGILTLDGAVIGGNASANATVNTLKINNGYVLPPRVVTASGAITITSNDCIVISNKTVGAATTVNLPAPGSNSGQMFTIKDGKGDAATNNLTLTPASGNIDGASTFVMNINYQSITLVDNGTQYNII